jgi:NADPH2:quinone reductase
MLHLGSGSVLIMRAISYSVTGDPSVLSLVEVPVPRPSPGFVVVRMIRSGVNPTDWKSRSGTGEPTPVVPAQIPGQDGAGIVSAVGTGVTGIKVDDRVWVWEAAFGRPSGTAQDYVLIPASQVVPLPDFATYDLGACLGIPFLTAQRCLTVTEDGPSHLGPGSLSGRTVLVAGGAGAVGNAAIQLARWSDATVITTVSSPYKGQLAAAAGADYVINYREQDVVAEIGRIAPSGINTIVEVSPAANTELDAQVIASHGSVALYATDGGANITVPIRSQMTPNARWQFVLVYTMPSEAKARAVKDVSDALGMGALAVGADAGLPLHHFSLEQTAEAHRAVQQSVVGKVLIDI